MTTTLAIAHLSAFRDGREIDSGTAFAVSPIEALTALHCVAETDSRTGAATGAWQIVLHFQDEAIPAMVIAASPRFDVAVLRLSRPLPSRFTPVPLAPSCHLNERWNSAGFLRETPRDEVAGTPLAGLVTAEAVPIMGGIPAIGLHCDQAAAGMPMNGASGAPVLVGPGPAAVGLIRWNPPSTLVDPDSDSGVVRGAGIYASSLAAAARDLAGVRLNFQPPHRPQYTADEALDRRIAAMLPVGRRSGRGRLVALVAVGVLLALLLTGGAVVGVQQFTGAVTATRHGSTGSSPTVGGAPPAGRSSAAPAAPPSATQIAADPCGQGAFPAEIAISPARGPVGTTITVTGKCFLPGERVDVRFHTDVIAQPYAAADGTFTARGKVPASYRPFAGNQFDVVATGKQSISSDIQPFDLTG